MIESTWPKLRNRSLSSAMMPQTDAISNCSGTSSAEDPRTSFIPIYTVSASRFQGTLDLAKHAAGQLLIPCRTTIFIWLVYSNPLTKSDKTQGLQDLNISASHRCPSSWRSPKSTCVCCLSHEIQKVPRFAARTIPRAQCNQRLLEYLRKDCSLSCCVLQLFAGINWKQMEKMWVWRWGRIPSPF